MVANNDIEYLRAAGHTFLTIHFHQCLLAGEREHIQRVFAVLLNAYRREVHKVAVFDALRTLDGNHAQQFSTLHAELPGVQEQLLQEGTALLAGIVSEGDEVGAHVHALLYCVYNL